MRSIKFAVLGLISLMITPAVALDQSMPQATLFERRDIIAQSWNCQPRKTCSKIRACGEAKWYLKNCSWGGKLDRDKDKIPCESICGNSR